MLSGSQITNLMGYLAGLTGLPGDSPGAIKAITDLQTDPNTTTKPSDAIIGSTKVVLDTLSLIPNTIGSKIGVAGGLISLVNDVDTAKRDVDRDGQVSAGTVAAIGSDIAGLAAIAALDAAVALAAPELAVMGLVLATGALALMNYQQAEEWAGYYDVQTLLNRTLFSLEDTWLDMTAAFNPLGADPAKMDDRQIDEIQHRIQTSLGRLIAVENIGHSLNDLYVKKLKDGN